MSGLWISTRTTVNEHGVFAEERAGAPVITAEGTGTVAMVAQLPWGPDDEVIVPTDAADRVNIIAPLGMDRTGSGWMCQYNKPWPDLRIVRALGTAAAKAAASLVDAVPAEIAAVVGKYKGVAGNDLVAVVADAGDGDANHFSLSVSVTNALGSTTDLFDNIDFHTSGADPVDCSSARLVGSITQTAAGRPLNGTYTFSGGADGSISSASYIGTPESGDRGLALLEGDPEIDIFFADDPGNTDRAAVNAGVLAHQLLMGDRVGCINGNSALSPSAVRAAVAVAQSTGLGWADPWFYQRDPAGTERLVAPACALAVVMANLPPSTSAAWKGQKVRAFLSFVSRLETARGAAKGLNTKAGICTLQKERKGGYTFEAAVNTAAAITPAKKNLTRTRMGIYIAKSVSDSLREEVDAPNVALVQNDILKAVASFLNGLKDNASQDPKGLVHIVNWEFGDLAGLNPSADIAAGDFTIPIRVTTSAGMERIFLSVEYGETVEIKAAA